MWLWHGHIPDPGRIPGPRRFALNTVKDVVRSDQTYVIAELHFDAVDSFRRAWAWCTENPVGPEVSPEGKTGFKFFVVYETETLKLEGERR